MKSATGGKRKGFGFGLLVYSSRSSRWVHLGCSETTALNRPATTFYCLKKREKGGAPLRFDGESMGAGAKGAKDDIGIASSLPVLPYLHM